MAKPDNLLPPRPPSVPAEARWDSKTLTWMAGPVDEDGRRHGVYRSWTRDGVLHGECAYERGRVHGASISFHPDGTIASEAEWQSDVVMNSVFHRSAAPTTEPFTQAAAGVWSVRYYTHDGKTNYTIRYFARDGVECGPDGQPLPTRPETVTADARWFPDLDRWVDGEIERATNLRVGRWRQWSRDGVLRHDEHRDAAGEPSLIAQYVADGALELEILRAAGGEQRDHYALDGTLVARTRIDARGRSIYKASWTSDGTIEHEHTRTYVGDELATVFERGPGGIRAFEARHDDRGLVCVLFGADGTIVEATGVIANGTLVGNWQVFAGGALRRELDVTELALEQEPTADGLAWTLGEALFRTDEPSFGTPPELAGLDREPWADLAGAFDHDVEQFPRLVRGLVSPDPQVRGFALDVITGEIVQPGATFPATTRVLPYLARLLAHPAADRTRLLRTFEMAAAEGRDAATARAIGVAWPAVFA